MEDPLNAMRIHEQAAAMDTVRMRDFYSNPVHGGANVSDELNTILPPDTLDPETEFLANLSKKERKKLLKYVVWCSEQPSA
jgi:hypothetical protein